MVFGGYEGGSTDFFLNPVVREVDINSRRNLFAHYWPSKPMFFVVVFFTDIVII